jgi:hypothetical protein
MTAEPTLYICWGLFRTPRPGHPCHNAYDAVTAAGITPNIVRCYGWGLLPRSLNRSRGPREVRRLTGQDCNPNQRYRTRRRAPAVDAIVFRVPRRGESRSVFDAVLRGS